MAVFSFEDYKRKFVIAIAPGYVKHFSEFCSVCFVPVKKNNEPLRNLI